VREKTGNEGWWKTSVISPFVRMGNEQTKETYVISVHSEGPIEVGDDDFKRAAV
jgi:hypothetical protein